MNLFLLLGLVILSGCKEEGEFTIPTTTLSFNNFDTLESMSITNEQNVSTHLLGFDSLGKEQEISNLSVVRYESVSTGIYVLVSEVHSNVEGDLVLPPARYFVEPNGAYHAVDTEGFFVGETDERKLIFSNADTYDLNTLNVQTISTNLGLPFVTGLSGNFITIQNSSGTISQVLDTLTSLRYNINSSSILSLNKTDVLMSGLLFNIVTNEVNTTINDGSLGTENIASKGAFAALVIGESQNGVTCIEEGKSCIYVFEANASSSIIGTNGYDIATTVTNGIENEILFSDENYIIVKELSQVSIISRLDFSVQIVLSDLNIASISYKKGKLYFIAEDKFGLRRNGRYDIALGESIYYTDGIATLAKLKALNTL
ncbi:hypothetical protein JHD50_03125 [Sulfurimonas sp. MAG313]|nr:hypothetical protein [Sulfurimonas sp. MAG313]MDF1880304.1 hypothetical protein [Sulfurimonas sp. MAG313]